MNNINGTTGLESTSPASLHATTGHNANHYTNMAWRERFRAGQCTKRQAAGPAWSKNFSALQLRDQSVNSMVYPSRDGLDTWRE